MHLGRPHHAVFLRIPDPVAEPGDALGLRQTRLALAQVVQGARHAQHLLHPVAQQRRGCRPGREVGGAGLLALVHGGCVVLGNQQQHRRIGHPRLRAQFENRLQRRAIAVEFAASSTTTCGAGSAHAAHTSAQVVVVVTVKPADENASASWERRSGATASNRCGGDLRAGIGHWL